MARQNIDEDWKTDPRRRALVKRLGSERLADGMRVEINWLVLDHKGAPIPLSKFQFVEDYQTWIDCGLAEVVGDEVKIAGGDRYAKFFERQSENGSKGGRPPKKEAITTPNPEKPKITQDNPTETQTKPEKPSFSFSKKKEPPIAPLRGGEAIRLEESFEEISKAYREFFPTTTAGPKARERFFAQITTQQRFCDLWNALLGYRSYLELESWRKPKTTFANFLGTERSGFFWESYRDWQPPAEASGFTTCGIARE